MNYFLDTSALLKRYIPEEGTDFIDGIFAGEKTYASSLTLTEAVSVFRRLREVKGVIEERDFQDLKTRLFADVAEGAVEILPLTMQDVITSTELASQRYMTPVDALILAAAVNLRHSVRDLGFVCFDAKLRALAGEYLTVIEPPGDGKWRIQGEKSVEAQARQINTQEDLQAFTAIAEQD